MADLVSINCTQTVDCETIRDARLSEFEPSKGSPDCRWWTVRVTIKQIKPVSLPTFELGLPAYYVIASSEASSNLSRYDGVRYGTRAPAADLTEMYTATRQVRTSLTPASLHNCASLAHPRPCDRRVA